MNKIGITLGKIPDTRSYCEDGQIKYYNDKYIFFADVVIDGNPLSKILQEYNNISILGWGEKSFQDDIISKMLLEKPSELKSGRYELYVCPCCADIGCGAITINILKNDNSIIWKDFGLEYNYKDNIQHIDIGPFIFEWDEYERVIKSSFRLVGYKYPWDRS